MLGQMHATADPDYIDHFKKFNDESGHQVYDIASLRGTVKVIKEQARKMDFVARYGGEDGGVIAPEADAAGALALQQRLRSRLLCFWAVSYGHRKLRHRHGDARNRDTGATHRQG